MRHFYLLSTFVLSFMCAFTTHAQEPTAADFAGEYYCKSVYGNEGLGLKGETRYIYFTIEYDNEEDALSLVSLGEEGKMISCAGTVLFEDGTLTICQTVDTEGAESGSGYAYYMGNNENYGHINTETVSKDKLILTNGIMLMLNNFTDSYEVAQGSKLYRVGTPEDPDVEPVTDLSPYAGQFYMTASVNDEDKQVTFTMTYDADENKLYLKSIGYENNEVACDDDKYEITHYNGTLSLPVVFTPDYTTSLYTGSFTIENKNKFIVSEEISGILNTFDMFSVESGKTIRRVGTVEEAWESIDLSELAGSYKISCVVTPGAIGSESSNEDTAGEETRNDIYLTVEYNQGTLSITSIGINRENMKEVNMPMTQNLGELTTDYYFGFDCTISGYMNSDLVFYIDGKDELTLKNGFSMLDYDTFTTYDVDSESQGKAIRIDEIPSRINSIKTDSRLPDEIYDLNGRRITVPNKGQIYIQNGKKHFCR